MNDSHNEYFEHLRKGLWFRQLSPELARQLLALASVRALQPGQRLFCRGDAPCGLYAVLTGAMRVGGVSREGKEALLALVEPPYWFGEISLFDGLPRTHDAYAEVPTQLLHLPQSAVLALLQETPCYWREMALLMSHKLRLAFTALEAMSLLPAAARVAKRLLMIAENYGEQAPRRMLRLAQEQLALMLGLSRQTTNQVLKELEAQAVLKLHYAEIEILDFSALVRLAEKA